MSKSVLNVTAVGLWGVALFGFGVLWMMPRHAEDFPVARLADKIEMAMVALERPALPERRLAKDAAPEELARHFFLRAKVEAAAPKPVPKPEPKVEIPEPTRELSFVGEVMIDGNAKLALYDVTRQTSFTVMPGESWSDWTCVGRTASAIVMRKHDKTYLVHTKK